MPRAPLAGGQGVLGLHGEQRGRPDPEEHEPGRAAGEEEEAPAEDIPLRAAQIEIGIDRMEEEKDEEVPEKCENGNSKRYKLNKRAEKYIFAL